MGADQPFRYLVLAFSAAIAIIVVLILLSVFV